MNWAALGLPEHGSAFNWRQTATLTPAQQAAEDARLANLARYHARTNGAQVRPYSMRFKTPEAYENHKKNAREYEKKKRDLATKQRNALKAAATRINKHNLLITHQTEAASDKLGALTGRSTPNCRDA